MKQKHKGIISIGLMVAAILVIVGYYYSGWWHKATEPPVKVVEPPKSSWTPTDGQLETIGRLSGRLPVLAYPAAKAMAPTSLALFGQRPESLGAAGATGHGNTKRGYVLSLTLVAGPMRYCIINGSFLTEGARMDDGSIVAKIENNRVLLATNDERQWVMLDDGQASSENATHPSGGPKGSQS